MHRNRDSRLPGFGRAVLELLRRLRQGRRGLLIWGNPVASKDLFRRSNPTLEAA
jgi:hypothetical protein